jgi:threonine 3-dehydrogenase
MGEIAEVGRRVKGLSVGQRVSGDGHITCGICPPCREGKRHLCMKTIGLGVKRPGCFAEYFTLPADNVFVLPEFVPDDIAAIFDPFGNAVHTTLSFPLTGEQILITGAGPIGIMAAAIAAKAGSNEIVITDVSDYRLGLARRMGAMHTVNIATQSLPEVMKHAGIEHGFTVGLEMSGHPQALADQLTYARHGAHIALLGILPPGCAIDWDLVIFKMLEIKGIYGREMFRTWHQMIHLLASGLDLSPIVTHRFSFEEFQKGFEAMFAGQCGKVVLSL